MSSDPIAPIEAWFADCDDGDFARLPRSAPYLVAVPASQGVPVIYATKPHTIAAAIDECDAGERVGLVGRYGLPSAGDELWIRAAVGSRELLYLGDMDPADLLIYAWLQARLQPKSLVHWGVSDRLLAELNVSLPESFTIAFSPSEQQSISLLRGVLPDYRDLVGPQCAAVLDRGRKIELEAVVSTLGGLPGVLSPLVNE